MTKLRITVTKEILERSKNCAGDSDIISNCAIALACRDIFPKATVGCGSLVFVGGNYEHWVILPSVAADFIRRFDDSSPQQRVVLPEISFEIEIPDEVIATINIDELKPLLENHPTLAIVS